ncbi:MAG: YggS family pyridoxal phosphate-dependent enzyme [Oscillospiraceae bacterium]|nr:YggS family pyridoxal phosphate-dependent enzyme [Oscillospiraceae bacterium]
MTIADNVRAVREKMAAAAARAGVDEKSVLLVAATKTNPAERVREAIAAGVDVCGENRVQEMLEKLGQGAYEGAPLHFIGQLQRNKVKYVVGAVDLIQSVGSRELLSDIAARAAKVGVTQDVLIEINVGREESKGGVLPEELDELAAFAGGLGSVRIRGLMAIPPITEKTTYFEQMFNFFVDIKQKRYDNVSMDFLSMGMSADFPAAIECGANMVRVGSAIFGPRS